MPIINTQLAKSLNVRRKALAYGFSLLEMAIVLAIIGLLMAGLLPSISNQIDQQHRSETRKLMEEIKDALYGFAISNGYLPCPASQVSGIEDRNGTSCNYRVGYLPWATLGVNQLDGWGRLFRYSASPQFTSGVFAISSVADITIKNLDGTYLSTASSVPVVIVSHGSNGIYGTLSNGNTISTAAPIAGNVARQQDNVSGVAGAGVIFYSADYTARTTTTDEDFDDQIVWISRNILINRMVTAGKLL